MKTKSLFYSLAIAAAMVSCTQETFDVVDNNVQDLSIRPTLGEVVLAGDADATTRLTTGSAARPVFSTQDKMGAAIMDAPLYPGVPYNTAKPWLNYDIVPYYSSNNVFSTENAGTSWFLSDDMPLVEGNYLFYAPYNENMVLRSPFEIRVPQRQDISEEKSALQAFYTSGEVVRLAHTFLAYENGEAQKPTVKFYDVMSYPKFTIINNFDGYLAQIFKDSDGDVIANDSLVAYSGAVKLDSIQIAYVGTGDGALVGGLLDHDKVVSAFTPSTSVTDNWDKPLNNYTADLLNVNAMVKSDSIITTFVAGGKEIAKGDTATFFAVMPAQKFAKNELQANIYVTIGEKPYYFTIAEVDYLTYEDESENEVHYADVKSLTKDGFAFSKNSASLLQGQAYPQEELNWDGTNLTTKKVKGSILTMVLAGGKLDGDEDPETLQVAKEVPAGGVAEEEETDTDKIDNNEEFIQFFKDTYSNADMTEGTEVDETEGEFAFSSNTTATINSELINALDEYQFDGSIKIKKALVIDNDVQVIAIDATNKVVTFKSNTGKTYDITFADDADYTLTEDYVLSGNTTKLSLHVFDTYEVSTETTFGNIRNQGTMTVSAKLTANAFVNNYTLNANADANIVKPMINNKYINVIGANAIMTISNSATARVQTEDATVTFNGVKVTGGEGRYKYTPDGTADVYNAIKNAEKIAWVNAFQYAGEVDFVASYTDGSASKTILENIVDIKTMYIDDLNLHTNGTIDMKNINLVFSNPALTTIEGMDISQTVVNNLYITNYTELQITLNNIDANGTLAYGELYADGYNATWNGEAFGVIALEEVTTGNWLVNTPAGLNKLAKMVNEENETFAGETVKLAADMDLNKKAFTPIGKPDNGPSDYAPIFQGTFDGNGKTISNLYIKEDDTVEGGCYTGLFGLIGGATIKNLTIDGAYIEGYHCVGAIVGQVYNGSTVKNCEVKNATVIATRQISSEFYDAENDKIDYHNDGDKAGAIVGLMSGLAASSLDNCKATDSSVSAGRDAGQIVGAAFEAEVTNCSASNVKVSANGTSTGANVNDEVIGRKLP